jgi:hypothetical protein
MEEDYYYVYRIDHIDWDDPEYYDTKEEAEDAISHWHSCSMNPYYGNPIKLKKLKRKVL